MCVTCLANIGLVFGVAHGRVSKLSCFFWVGRRVGDSYFRIFQVSRAAVFVPLSGGRLFEVSGYPDPQKESVLFFFPIGFLSCMQNVPRNHDSMEERVFLLKIWKAKMEYGYQIPKRTSLLNGIFFQTWRYFGYLIGEILCVFFSTYTNQITQPENFT